MLNINYYKLALLSTEGKFSCCKSARNLNNISHDKLTRFLSKTTLKEEIEIKSLPKGGDLIFDDSSINKSSSKNIEGVSWVWCSTLGKAIKGFCFIKIIYVYNDEVYNLADIFWRKGGKTKNKIIREKLQELYEKGIEPGIILFDCFYAACKNLNLINSFNWKYLSLCRSNKIFEKQQIQKYKFYGGNSLYGKARGIYHKVQIAKHCNRYIITNLDKPIKSHSGWKIYQRRWLIETIFRDLKTNLHLEECSSRSLISQINHVQACMDAYLYLKEHYPNQSLESAHQDYLHTFRAKKFNNINDYCSVA